jgi:hypothetical protein
LNKTINYCKNRNKKQMVQCIYTEDMLPSDPEIKYKVLLHDEVLKINQIFVFNEKELVVVACFIDDPVYRHDPSLLCIYY